MSGVNEIAMLDVNGKRLIVCDKELKLKKVNQEITKTNYFHCFIRKSDQAVLCTDHYDLFKGILWHGEQMIEISEDQEYMLTYVIPGELFDYRDEMVKNYGQERLKSEFSELNELCNSTKIDDNPVILYIKLKKDAESRK